jgi:hypothetical protein
MSQRHPATLYTARQDKEKAWVLKVRPSHMDPLGARDLGGLGSEGLGWVVLEGWKCKANPRKRCVTIPNPGHSSASPPDGVLDQTICAC